MPLSLQKNPRVFSWLILALAALGALIAILATISSTIEIRAIDQRSVAREQAIVRTMIDQQLTQIPRDQEIDSVWSQTLAAIQRNDMDFIDHNVGQWYHDFFGHHAVYVLDRDNHPLYATRDGKRLPPAAYAEIEPIVAPMLAALRALPPGTAPERSHETVGYTEIAIVDQRPAIISIKPIVGDKPVDYGVGYHPTLVNLVFLDDRFLNKLQRQLHIHDLKLVGQPPRGDHAWLPLVNHDGKAIGYFAWTPFNPAQTLAQRMVPLRAGVVFFVIVLLVALAFTLRRRTEELLRSNKRSQYLATHDVLTGLPNRTLLQARLDKMTAQDGGSGKFGLLMLDVDRFKQVNDMIGHIGGDALIRATAQRIRNSSPEDAFVARLGGDEFALIVPAPILASTATAILAALDAPLEVDGRSIKIEASIGGAVFDGDCPDADRLMRNADAALFSVKAAGGGHSSLFDTAMAATQRSRSDLERQLRDAVANCDASFTLFYQPIVSADDRTLLGAEALLRWKSGGEPVPPSVFMPMAEETQLIHALGNWIIDRSVADARRLESGIVSLNMSPLQLLDDQSLETLRAAMAREGVPADRLMVEITESAAATGGREFIRRIERIRSLGIAIALDDFGTGYSSLAHLRDFPIDRIKFDRGFMHDSSDGRPARMILSALVGLANNLGLPVTAEGVESEDDLQMVQDVGCDACQGFFIAKPMPLDQFILWRHQFEAGMTTPGQRRFSASR